MKSHSLCRTDQENWQIIRQNRLTLHSQLKKEQRMKCNNAMSKSKEKTGRKMIRYAIKIHSTQFTETFKAVGTPSRAIGSRASVVAVGTLKLMLSRHLMGSLKQSLKIHSSIGWAVNRKGKEIAAMAPISLQKSVMWARHHRNNFRSHKFLTNYQKAKKFYAINRNVRAASSEKTGGQLAKRPRGEYW